MKMSSLVLSAALVLPVAALACSSSDAPATGVASSAQTTSGMDACMSSGADATYTGGWRTFQSNGVAYASTACGAFDVAMRAEGACNVSDATLADVTTRERCAAISATYTIEALTITDHDCSRVPPSVHCVPETITTSTLLGPLEVHPLWVDANDAGAGADGGVGTGGCRLPDHIAGGAIDPSLYDDVRVIVSMHEGTVARPVAVTCRL